MQFFLPILPPLPRCPGDALRGYRHQGKLSSIVDLPPMFTYRRLSPLHNQLSNEQEEKVENYFALFFSNERSIAKHIRWI